MTVKELIEELQEIPPNKFVYFFDIENADKDDYYSIDEVSLDDDADVVLS